MVVFMAGSAGLRVSAAKGEEGQLVRIIDLLGHAGKDLPQGARGDMLADLAASGRLPASLLDRNGRIRQVQGAQPGIERDLANPRNVIVTLDGVDAVTCAALLHRRWTHGLVSVELLHPGRVGSGTEVDPPMPLARSILSCLNPPYIGTRTGRMLFTFGDGSAAAALR